MRTIKSLFWSFLEQFGATTVSLIVQLVLARLLAPEAFGMLAILLVVVDMVNILSQAGLGLAIVQRANADPVVYSTAFWMSIGLSIVLYLMVFLGAPLIASFYNMAELSGYLRVLALAVFFNVFNSVQRAYLQERMCFKLLFSTRFVAVFVSGLSGIAAALLGLGVWALIAQVLIQSLVSCISLMIVVPWKPQFQFSFPIARELIEYGGKLCITSVLDVLYGGLSELILGRVCSALQLGLYSQGRKWPNRILSIASNAIQNVLFPLLAKKKDDMEAFRRSVRRILVTGTYVIMPISILLALIAKPLIAILLTEKWLPSTLVFQCLCIANALLMVQMANLRAYMALGFSGLYLKLEVVKVTTGATVLGLTAFLTRDIYSVAIASMIFSFFAIVVVDMWPAKRVIGIGRAEQLKSISPIIVVTGISTLVASPIAWIGLPYVVQLLLQVFVFAGIYVAISYFFKIDPLFECVNIFREAMDTRKPI